MSRHLENDQTESRSVFPGGDGFHDGDYKCQIGACCQSWFVPRDLQKRLSSIIDAHKTDGRRTIWLSDEDEAGMLYYMNES